MRSKFTLLLLLFVSIGYSQVTNEGKPASWDITTVENAAPVVLPDFDLATILKEDLANDGKKDRPFRFGHEFLVDNNLDNSGTWTNLPNGDRIWRIRYFSKGAKTMNFVFSDFYMPEGASIYLYSNDRSDVLGAYTASQNTEERVLGTWLVQGEDIWIEYFEPKSEKNQGQLQIAKVVHGYRSSNDFLKSPDDDLNVSGACNYDVDCDMGNINALKDINKRSVALIIVGNSGFCTGALINNTSNDGTPYFLTAHHCSEGENVNQWSFRFNWISPNPVCAQNRNSTNNAPNYYQTVSGAVLRARRAQSDFCLLEITAGLPSNWDLVYSGWNRTTTIPTSTFGIHHPSGDIMKACKDNNRPTSTTSDGVNVWRVQDWDMGVTEGGSSGSPLFDNNGRIIGQLLGGAADCNGTTDNGGFDEYGRLNVSWNAGTTPNTRLRDWLDPIDNGATVVDYYRPTTMGVIENTIQHKIKIYPNPSNGIYTVSLNESAYYQVYNVLGQQVKSGELSSASNNTVNLASSPKGIYLLTITDLATNKTANFKLIKE